MEIKPINHTPWWQDGDRLEQAAAAVCTRYDILGLMIEFDRLDRKLPGGSYGNFFAKNWAESIIQTHDALQNYMAYRRSTAPKAYIHFTRLRDHANRYHCATLVGSARN